MLNRQAMEFLVGVFLILGIVSVFFLALQVSGLTEEKEVDGYTVTGYFGNIGSLKPRAAVKIAGVKIGQVNSITLDSEETEAVVTMTIQNDVVLTTDAEAKILTQGLLGSNFIALSPGYGDEIVDRSNVVLSKTHSALVLEDLILQVINKFNKNQDN